MKPIPGFLLLACGISWATVGLGWLLGVRSTADPGYTLVAALAMLGPALAAFIRYRLLDRMPWSVIGLHPRNIRWRWMGWTVAVGVCIVPCFFLVIALGGQASTELGFGEVSITNARFLTAVQEMMAASGAPEAPSDMTEALGRVPAPLVLVVMLVAAVIGAFSINLPFMFGEEFGWRGYLFQRTDRWSASRRVLFTGVVWGLWHAPLIAMGHNYPGHPMSGIALMVLFCTALACLFDWSRWRSGSVWAPCVLHGLINGTAGATALFSWGGHPLVGSVAGLAGIIAVLLLFGGVLLFDGGYRRTLRAGELPMAP